jgi:hypothetical protein
MMLINLEQVYELKAFLSLNNAQSSSASLSLTLFDLRVV